MAERGKFLESLWRRDRRENIACLVNVRSCVFAAVEEKDRASDAGGVLHWIVGKAVEATLKTSPKHQQLRRRKRRQLHQLETMADRRQHPVENALGADRVRLDAA